MAKLQLEQVGYRYKNARQSVLEHVNVTFLPGEMAAVIGPSGSGKTTLLSLLAGLDRPSEGVILLNGEDLSKMDPDRYRREKASVIFQSFQLFPLLTVLENVCCPMELLGTNREDAVARARELLREVNITAEQERRFPSQLSGGEQQRVAIARALASGARILLADEPTGNLDEENSRNIISILGHLARDRGYCVIVVTHDMAAAAAADCVYELRDRALLRRPVAPSSNGERGGCK